MNNIEKFQQIKELTRLKSEYHKAALVDLFTIDINTSDSESQEKETDIVDLTFTGITFFKQIVNLSKQQANEE